MSKRKGRTLEPIGVYDPYRPRMFGTEAERDRRFMDRAVLDMKMTNEAFAARKQREIAARTGAVARQDAIEIEASLKAERQARRHRVTRS